MHTQTFKLLQLTGQLLIGNYNSIKLGLADHLLCQESPQAGKISGWQDSGSRAGAVEEKTGNSCAFSAGGRWEGESQLHEAHFVFPAQGECIPPQPSGGELSRSREGEALIRPGSMKQNELRSQESKAWWFLSEGKSTGSQQHCGSKGSPLLEGL